MTAHRSRADVCRRAVRIPVSVRPCRAGAPAHSPVAGSPRRRAAVPLDPNMATFGNWHIRPLHVIADMEGDGSTDRSLHPGMKRPSQRKPSSKCAEPGDLRSLKWAAPDGLPAHKIGIDLHLIPSGMQLSDVTRCGHTRQHYPACAVSVAAPCRVRVSRSWLRRSWSRLLWADAPETLARSSIEPQRSHTRSSDARYAPFPGTMPSVSAGEAEPPSLAAPLADAAKGPPREPERASDLHF